MNVDFEPALAIDSARFTMDYIPYWPPNFPTYTQTSASDSSEE